MRIVTGGVMCAILLLADSAKAQDTFRLGDAGEASLRTLLFDGQDETVDVGLFDKLFGRNRNQCDQCNSCNQCNPCDNHGSHCGGLGLFKKKNNCCQSPCGQNPCAQFDSRNCGAIRNDWGCVPCDQGQRGCFLHHGSKAGNQCGNECGSPGLFQKCFSGCKLLNKGSQTCNPCGNGCSPCPPAGLPYPGMQPSNPSVIPVPPAAPGSIMPEINDVPDRSFAPRESRIRVQPADSMRYELARTVSGPNPYAIPIKTQIAQYNDAPNPNAIPIGSMLAQENRVNPQTYTSLPARSRSSASKAPRIDVEPRTVPAVPSESKETYIYDGGPQSPIPLPINKLQEAQPNRDRQPQYVPRQGYPISFSGQTAAAASPAPYTYKAYGE